MKLNQLMNDFLINGALFTKMNEMYNLPFKNDVIDFLTLDIDFMTRYGERETSPLIDTLLEGNYALVKNTIGEYVLDSVPQYVRVKRPYTKDEILSMLSAITYQRLNNIWSKLYVTLHLDYNPIHNYDVTEDEITNDDVSRNVNETRSVDVEQKNTGTSKTENETNLSVDNSDTNTNVNYGFNSSNAVNSNGNDGTSSSTTTGNADENYTETTDNLTQTNKGSTGVNAHNTIDRDVNRTLHRKGNIGVTTTQKMIEEERKTALYDYFKTIFKQVSELITIPIYVL